jgi:hypothetical protein
MPKVPPKPVALGKQPPKKPRIPPEGLREPTENPLSIEERTELKEIFRNPVFVKAFENAKLCKPPSFVAGMGTALAPQISMVALSRIQGCDMFSDALLVQTKDKIPKREALVENYADPLLPPIPN